MPVINCNHKLHNEIRIALLIAIIISALGVAGPNPSFAQDTKPPTLLIVFDASGSMWGKIPQGSNAKFEAAHSAINNGLKKSNNIKTGLIIFGGSCSGVRVAVPPTPKSAQSISSELNRLNPRSKGPISLALRTAKETIDPKARATIMLIHDGADNCQQDPCAIAKEIRKTHKKTTIHLLSIDNSNTDARAMRCVPKLTGGKTFIANSPEQIENATKKIVAMLQNKPALTSAPETKLLKKRDRRAKSNIAPDGPPHLSLYATLTDNGPDVAAPIRWQVFKEDKPDVPILDVVEQSFTIPLPSGRYVVKAATGQAKISKKVQVAAKGETILTVPLNAGLLTFPATSNVNQQTDPLSNAVPTFLTLTNLSAKKSDTVPTSTPVLLNTHANNDLILPAGKYLVTLEHGASKTTKTITVAAGKSQLINVAFATGELHLKATTSANDKLQLSPLFKVLVNDPDAPGGRRELARSTAPIRSSLCPQEPTT